MSNSHTLSYNNFFKRIMIRSNCIQSLKTYFVRDIKHLFYIIFCDFNFCGPEFTAEITGYTVYIYSQTCPCGHLY